MELRTFRDLARDLQQRRVVGDPPPALLLGAGASVESGVGAMTDLFRFLDCADWDAFCAFIQGRSDLERYRYLSQFLQSRKPEEVTPGYRALAALCAAGYLELVLTTNLDPLIDDALATARLKRKDYLLLVNGVIRPSWLGLLVGQPYPRVKVVKLHGDLFHRCMAWTPAEMETFVQEVGPPLHKAVSQRDVLVVGHSLHDAKIRELALQAQDALWYIHPQAVPDFLTDDRRVRGVVGAECTFERLLTRLAKDLVPGWDGAAEAPDVGPSRGLERAAGFLPFGVPFSGTAEDRAETLDDLIACVVGLAGGDGAPFCTGFVLARPRVIVTEGFSGGTLPAGDDKVTVVASDGRRLPTRLLRRDAAHPFGATLVEVPPGLKVPGLRLDATPLPRDLAVQVAVAAGERVGISSGRVADPGERQLEVAPVGRVGQLVAVECVVAPGSAGAPVVDDALAVRGYIVAGSTDRPPSFMYPAPRWGGGLDALPPA
jgi:hypothetical protein